MAQRDLRYGLIGAGLMGQEHLRNVGSLPGVSFVTVADPHGPSREQADQLLDPGALVCADYRELLARDDLDAIVIATPNHTHIDVIRDAMATGKHILCEKPLCTTIDDARAVAGAVEHYSAVFWVAMEYRYMPPVARLIETVHSGEIGPLKMLAIREHRFPFLPKVGDWNRFNRNTGGTLVEKCCHFFDLMRLVTCSEPVRVYASGAQDLNHLDERYEGETPDILDNAFVIVDFENGVRAMLDLCMFAEGSKNQEEIAATGSRGKVEAFLPSSKVTLASRESGS
ncbi:MAG: Gfo/Idh/MocA family protein, partial [Dehalococcoidia bacterium]